ncbi:GlxA family transcriptional regulator [Noviherbaspirillum sp. UKPF54]|uniref:GlxA family transcriptional regulator n=1 Tax=Noviherbaspirillum sp. UKPF54 TaxID=2601898 RepID=UPI0011B178B0|nr:helix-turn-helix domain-containing protein [Noviherbaspirillum sp. UKPF54]QDZ27226.1 helix-turn-helix domain-containing protein [Noviherbaspirillum sp. UKPF54]
MQTILILALDGVMDSGLSITLDTLKAGCTFLAGAGRKDKIRIVTAGYKKCIKTGAGLRLTADMTFKEVIASRSKPNWIVLPGAGLTSDKEITARLAKKDAIEAMRLLQACGKAQSKISAACSSVFLLAESGMLSGCAATTTWWLSQIFRTRYPDIRLDESRMLVRDGQFLTAGSAFAQLDLALAIVADTMGASIAHLCSRYLLIDQRTSQARYMIQTHMQHMDQTVLAAERWIDAHLSVPISVTALSSELAMSGRTLARRIQLATGVSPVKFIQRRKLMHAVHLIETTALSIDAIAEKIGYQDGTALRKLVKREFGTTPGGLR